ncbi:MAG: PAS domain-containing protein [Chloracidobacterium sp.]|nr:PAS domain-containing protein [Chloracidobacterium sp.]
MTAKRPLILIVDDAPEDIAIYKRHLTRGSDRRYKIREATTGTKALAICQRRRPDCLLLDFRLPDINGLEVLHALAEKSGSLPCAVIMLAEIGDTHIVVDAMKYGAHDFLEKNWITPEMLERAVANAIEKAALQREVEEQRRELAFKNLMLEQQLADLQREVHERRQVEEALTGAERRFKRLVEALPGVVWMSDETGSVTYRNDHWTELTGLTIEEGLGERWTNVIHPDDMRPLAESWKLSIAAGAPHVAPHRYRRWDGEYRWHLCRAVPLRDESGAVREWVGVSIDIHDRYEAEKALGESEARYRALVEASSQLVWTAGANGINYDCWEWWSEITGVPARELAGGRWVATVHREDRRALSAIWRRTREAQFPFEVEFRLRARDGEYRHYRARGVPLSAGAESDGHITWIGTLEDVTDRRRAEDALRLANERFTAAEAASNGYVYDRNPASNNVERSAGFCAVLGYDEGDVAESVEWWKTLIHPDEIRRVSEIHSQLASGRGMDEMDGYSLEYRIRHKDGRYLWVWDRGRLTRDETGRVTRVVGSVVDISGRKQIENSLRESESRLKLAIAAMNGGAWEWNLVTNELRWSDEMYELFDSRPSDFTPTVEGWLNGLSTEDRARAIAAIEAVRRGEDAQLIYSVIGSDGTTRWLELRGLTLHDEQGRPVLMVGITIDITERKLAEEALRESEEKFSKVFKTTSHRIAITTLDEGHYVDVNDAVLLTTGYDRSEIIGRDAEELGIIAWPEGRNRLVQELQNGPIRNLEVPMRSKSGNLRTVSMSADIITLSGRKCVLTISYDITERKQAEEALRESEERFRTLADTIPSITWMASADGIITFHNQRWIDYCGVTPKEDDDWMRLVIHPDDLERCQAEWDRANELSRQFEAETRLRRSDGEYRWFLVRATPAFDAVGCDAKWFGVATDIHDRRQAEEALRESEERLSEKERFIQSLIDAVPAGIYIYDLKERRNLFTNPRLASQLGYTSDDLAGMGADFLPLLMHPDDWRLALAHFGALREAPDGFVLEIEYRMKHHDGQWRWIAGREMVFLRGEDGWPSQILGVAQEITERKLAEEDLQRANRRYQITINALDGYIYEYNVGENVSERSKGFSKMLGFETEESSPHLEWWIDHIHPDDRDYFLSEVERMLAEDSTPRRESHYSMEYRLVHKEGHSVDALDRSLVVRDPEGRPVQVIGVVINITERKRVEEALRENEERLRMALEGAKAGVWEVKFVPYSAYWSKEYRDLFGFSESDEATNEVWATRVHPNDLQRVVDGNNALLSSGKNEMRQEFRIVHPIHGERWILDFVRVRRDQAGHPISFGGINLDVTDRRRAEEKLRESEERFRELVSTIPNVFWIMRPESQAPTYLSPACERLWGRPAAELNGGFDKWVNAIHPEDRERVRKKYLARAGEGDYDETYRVVRPDGSMVWVHDRGFPVCDEAGNIRHIVGVAEDITDRKRFEDELRESERRYAALAEAVPQLVWTAGPDGGMDYFNQRWYAYTGTTPDESLNQNWRSLIHPDDRERVERLWKRVVKVGESLHVEFRLRGADGAHRWFTGRGAPYREEKRGGMTRKPDGENGSAGGGNGVTHNGVKGRIVKWFGTFTDIHDLKMAEEALRESEEQARRQNAELENIYQATPVGLSLLDRDFRYVRLNETMAKIDGASVDRALGRTAREVTPKMADRLEPVFKRVIKTGRPFMNLEIRAEAPCEPGVGRDWLASYYPVKAADGSVQGIGCVVLDITERKRAEEAVRESEERLRQAAQAAGFGLYSVNLQTGENYWSPELRRIFGVSDDETVLLDSSIGLIHPDDREETMRVVEAALDPRGDGEFEHEFRAQLTGGNTRWALARGKTLFTGSGRRRKASRIIGVAFDITERRVDQERLHASEELFRTMFDLSGIGILQVDPSTGIFLRANRELCDWLGYSEGELLEMKLEAIVHPDDLEYKWTDIGRLLRGEVDEHVAETRCVRKDGRAVWGLITSRILRDASGRPFGAVTAVTDITERKRAEEALRESERRLKLSLAAGRAGTWEWRIKENKLIWSDEYYDLYGLAPGDLEPTLDNYILCVHPEDRDRILAEMSEVLQERKDAELEFRFIRAGGDTRWAHSSAQLTLDESGEPEVLVGIMIDITERKQAEMEREDLLRKEREAREQAEAANRGKDEFVAMVSHELRSPLNAMLGWAKILKKGGVDVKTQSHAVEVIERSARAQQTLIEDLLDMARIVGGKLRLDTRPVSLARVVEAAVDVVRPAAEAREIDLQHLINSADEVTGDPDRLQQVVWNLLSNAVKFTMRGGSVEVILERVGASAQITVTDTGRGIKAEDLPYIFDRFRQADSSGSRRFAGLGLGLALVKHLVELHGGQVYADSLGEGKGASFIVRLPVRAVRGEATPARGLDRANLRLEERDGRAIEREARSAYPAFPLDGVWALIVDDEADARELIATLLKQYGARVTVASCAAEAFDKLRKGEADARPDVLVSDISMPDEDGYMLIERVRKLPPEEGGKIPAIALTALERPNDRIKALASGFSMHVPKPVEPEELAMVIANLTGHPAGIIL